MSTARSLALGFVFGALSTASVASASYLSPLQAASRLIADAAQATYELDRAAQQVREPGLRNQLRQQTYALSTHLDGLQRIVQDASVPQHVQPQAPVTTVVDDATFARILRAVDDAPFSDGKQAVVFSAVGNRWVTTRQVGQLLASFPFSSDQVDVAARLYPNTLDPENWFEIYRHLDFDSARTELRRRTEGR